MKFSLLPAWIAFAIAAATVPPCAGGQASTRGIGIYPGDPAEDFSPRMQIDTIHYRNLALHRAAYQSDSYDFNLTAQLITDGIIETRLPGWIATSTSTGGVLPKDEREWVLDRQAMSWATLDSPHAWLQVEMAGDYAVPAIDSMSVSGMLFVDSLQARHWDVEVAGSEDGVSWMSLGKASGDVLPGDTLTGFLRRVWPSNLRSFSYGFGLHAAVRCRFYRVSVNSPNALRWRIGELGMYAMGRRAEVGGPYQFASVWKSDGGAEAWVSVDLGAPCRFDRVVLYWIRRAAAGSLQVSDDAKSWTDIASLNLGTGDTMDVRLAKMVHGRYVRVRMTKPGSTDGYMLSELEVYGTGGPVPVPHSPAGPEADGRIPLRGGHWKLQRCSLVRANGADLSRSGFDDSSWIAATVPGTILASYKDAGALPDPNFGDNQLAISESFFYSDFWYRKSFTEPPISPGRRTFITFTGINWKAEVYCNGRDLGGIDGAFMRKTFDLTGILVPGENALAVRVFKNATPGFATEQTRESPGPNGGELGADNPTFHASVGWDWIPTIRGRNTGIWDDVWLSTSGPVTMENPFVSTTLPLPDTTAADVRVEVTLRNWTARAVAGRLHGNFGPARFEQRVVVPPDADTTVTLTPRSHPSLRLHHPKLWWPNGYGAQNLVPVMLEYTTPDGNRSDRRFFRSGVRTMTYSEEGGALRIWVNGRRFIARGGNWGFPESMLQYRAREYDIAVKYHEAMNFTMIRNWVGQTADEAFYEACDRHGIMVWQDFWLANPFDGPDPRDGAMFIRNADDFVRRIRNHPSIALYVGRNEGNPPPVIDSALSALIHRLHPGLQYIPNSAFGVVSGGGPYRRMPTRFYFEKRATEKLHSEIGMPAMVSLESLRSMIPDSLLWPQGPLWGLHDFTLEGAQQGASFNKAIDDHFGPAGSLAEWLPEAQWITYDGYRAMFEAQGKYRMGVLLWMSHPAWPSMVWQTYDYSFEPTAAYFGSKKACEPLHIQWNAFTDSIEVVNYSIPDGSRLTAEAEILNMDGSVRWKYATSVDCAEDSMVRCCALASPVDVSAVHFVRLTLRRGRTVLSRNFYVRGTQEDNLRAIRELPKVKLDLRTSAGETSKHWRLRTTLTNRSTHPALMVRLAVVRAKTRDRILPVLYDDNFISLMPGEHRTITMDLDEADARGEKPDVVVHGFNVQ